ncbi:MAG: hypothetical protein P0116_01450 [Candidatus Nitrosocosmicus sp.]|nr:hypothetical protein [Candidatus Nitrosocosmicus sp.]
MSAGNKSHNDPTEPSQEGEPTDLDSSSFPTENFNDMKTSNEESIDSNFMIEAVHHAKEGKIVVPEAKQQDQLRNKGFGEIFNKEYVLNSLEKPCIYSKIIKSRFTITKQNMIFLHF